MGYQQPIYCKQKMDTLKRAPGVDHSSEESSSSSPLDLGIHHVDNILHALNPTGRYQILHYLTIVASIVGTCFQMFSNVFIAMRVPHLCAAPPEGSNWTDIFGDTENLTVVRDKCGVSLRDNVSVLGTASCVYGNEYTLDIDSSVISQFDLVCDTDWLIRLSQTLLFLGQGVGAMLTAYFSDRFGRKFILVIVNFGLLACGLVIAVAPNAAVFVLFKFFIGAFHQGSVMATLTFLLEILPLELRDCQAWASGFVSSGTAMLLALVAFLLKDYSWRVLQTVISLASLLFILQWWYLDESLRWLMANGKSKEAIKVIKRIASVNRRNGDTIIEKLQHTASRLTTEDSKGIETAHSTNEDFEIKATEHLSLFDIFKVPKLLLTSVCMWLAWFVTALGYFTIYLTATSLAGNPYVNFALTGLVDMIQNIFLIYILKRMGRKHIMQLFFGVLAAGILLTNIFKALEERNSALWIFTLLSSLVSMFGASGCFDLVFMYTPEAAPTNLRSQAVGIASFIGRIGAMLAPFMGLLAEQAIWAPGLVTGILAMTVCLWIHFLPETKGRELPQTLPELQAWYEQKHVS